MNIQQSIQLLAYGVINGLYVVAGAILSAGGAISGISSMILVGAWLIFMGSLGIMISGFVVSGRSFSKRTRRN